MIEQVLMLVSPIVASIVTYLVTRRKYNASVDDAELDNVSEAIRIWRETAQTLESKLKDRDNVIEELRDLMLGLQANHSKVLIKLTALEADYNSLNKKYKELKD